MKIADQLHVRLKPKGYHILWLSRITELTSIIKQKHPHTRFILITNHTIYALYQELIHELVPKQDVIQISDGEEQKNLQTIETLSERLLKLGAERKSMLLALGGGVVGDITGFLASVYMRGIPYIQIPTTLLAMVDSSVGGKTGVNSSLGKNMIGSFHQPAGVFICVEFLKTLPERELRCGLAEAVKSALIKDLSLYRWIESHTGEIQKTDMTFLHRLSYESVRIKRWVVQKDEKEKNLRAILNLGHTLAHAIENYFEYKLINHGEAVSVGLSFAVYYSFKKGYLTRNDALDFQKLLHKLSLPKSLKDISDLTGVGEEKNPSAARLVELMKTDKKNQAGELYFVFIKKIGKYVLPQRVEIQEVREALEEWEKS